MTTKTGINEAFCKAQALIGGARKTATNPHFKSKYADLKECFNACSDILNEHGIHITQPTIMIGETLTLRTVMTHTSGEVIADAGIPIAGWQNAKNPMQSMGSAITYARRYGLCSLVGIAPEDDDGNSLTQDKPAVKTITDNQVKELLALSDEVGADKGKFCAYLGVAAFTEINTMQFDMAKAALEKKRAADVTPETNQEQA
jgi:hypothetical protein